MDLPFEQAMVPDDANADGLIAGDGARKGLVLDIETAPDPHALILARRLRGAPKGSPLHEVINVSVLTFVELSPGRLADFKLQSWHRDDLCEADILINVHRALQDVVEDRGIVATFNGRGHDLPVLQNRMLRWWMCESSAIPRIEAGEARHIDLMLELSAYGQARWPSLSDACASVGFSLKGPTPIGRNSEVPREMEKCELDVIGTAILLHYVLAQELRSRRPLEKGLAELGRFLRLEAGFRPHFQRFAQHDLLSDRARAWKSKSEPMPRTVADLGRLRRGG